MAEIPDLQQRLDDLEIHITHQDSVIQELNEVTIQQWAAIEKLTGKLEFLKNKLQAAEDSMESGETQEPPPPHY
ncbi:MAG: SlyX family protein [Alphaproteobacteria bacterium]|jgi:SlyX protein|nr:SlyX family protein [Alphaproteobacteria bacterium]|tara:strand:+ start:84 stop:305 length:222 start_codon:yes stop_codon:yes gene_type:complete